MFKSAKFADASYRSVGSGIPKWHIHIQNSGKSPQLNVSVVDIDSNKGLSDRVQKPPVKSNVKLPTH